jgi:sialate O-acetylesterase
LNIHPPYKLEVGERLALLALNNDYGMSIPFNGPVYKSMTLLNNIVKIGFENTGGGLIAKNGKLEEFEIAGRDGNFFRAEAKIVNDEVWVSSPKVKDPVAVRYCWRNGSVASLFNTDGFAAWQFRTK